MGSDFYAGQICALLFFCLPPGMAFLFSVRLAYEKGAMVLKTMQMKRPSLAKEEHMERENPLKAREIDEIRPDGKGAKEKTSMEDEASLEYQATIQRVSGRSMAVNIALAGFKFLAGFVGHSAAMISDAIHSSSDVFGSLIVIVGATISGKKADDGHPYGHERFECVAALLLSLLLALAGIEILKSSVESISSGSYSSMAAPGVIALVAAFVSIAVKEAMFWYVQAQAKRISSSSLRAEAWHHRSDALSSIGALIGIAGARLGVKVLEPVAGLVISLFILKAAVDIFLEAVNNFTDHSADSVLSKQIYDCVMGCQGVRSVDLLNTRQFGHRIYVDVEVGMDGALSLDAAHGYAQKVHDTLEKSFPEIKHVMVHMNPFAGERE